MISDNLCRNLVILLSYLKVINKLHFWIVVSWDKIHNKIYCKHKIHCHIEDIKICCIGVRKSQTIRSQSTCHKYQSKTLSLNSYIVITISHILWNVLSGYIIHLFFFSSLYLIMMLFDRLTTFPNSFFCLILSFSSSESTSSPSSTSLTSGITSSGGTTSALFNSSSTKGSPGGFS